MILIGLLSDDSFASRNVWPMPTVVVSNVGPHAHHLFLISGRTTFDFPYRIRPGCAILLSGALSISRVSFGILFLPVRRHALVPSALRSGRI